MNFRRLFSLILAVMMLATACFSGALAEQTADEQPEDVLTDEQENELINNEPKVVIDKNDLAITPGLDPAWYNILLMGSDSRISGKYGRTDSMVILSVNTSTKTVKMTSLMRDMWVPMHGRAEQKLTAANVFGGPALVMRTVNECFGMNIEDYILIDMQAIEAIIDMVGGIEVDLTELEMYALRDAWKSDDSGLIDPPTEFGENIHLTGEQALAYARLRSIDDDFQRTVRQRTVLLAMARKITQSSIGDLMSLVSECMNYVETDITITDALQLALAALQVDLDNVEQFRLPASGAYTTETMKENKLWVMHPDFEANTKALYDFIYGVNE